MSQWRRSDSISALIGGVGVAVAGAVSFLAARGGLGLDPGQWHTVCWLTALLVEIVFLVLMVRCIVNCDGEGWCILRCIGLFLVVTIIIGIILVRCLKEVVA